MANLTISVDEDIVRRARIRALEQGTSVNAVLREMLAAYAGAKNEQAAAAADLVAISVASESRRGGKAWTRDDLHERR
ncbi:MAG TPA: hypothetical protein PKD55_09065 [Bellilinea sp.]|nr:hypothetical protein [Bellilinea sp.]